MPAAQSSQFTVYGFHPVSAEKVAAPRAVARSWMLGVSGAITTLYAFARNLVEPGGVEPPTS